MLSKKQLRLLGGVDLSEAMLRVPVDEIRHIGPFDHNEIAWATLGPLGKSTIYGIRFDHIIKHILETAKL